MVEQPKNQNNHTIMEMFRMEFKALEEVHSSTLHYLEKIEKETQMLSRNMDKDAKDLEELFKVITVRLDTELKMAKEYG